MAEVSVSGGAMQQLGRAKRERRRLQRSARRAELQRREGDRAPAFKEESWRLLRQCHRVLPSRRARVGESAWA